jgi:hypothetical protein
MEFVKVKISTVNNSIVSNIISKPEIESKNTNVLHLKIKDIRSIPIEEFNNFPEIVGEKWYGCIVLRPQRQREQSTK